MKMIQSPLEQFEIINYIPLVDSIQIYFTNYHLTLFWLFVGTIFCFAFLYYKNTIKINNLQYIFIQIYQFVYSIVASQVGSVGLKYFPFFLYLFFFLTSANLLGMIPYSFTITSHFLITLSLSFSIFIGINIIAFKNHGLHYFTFFLPKGIPFALSPFLVLIELISYMFRGFSLAIRLFANMTSGHVLLKILAGFGWNLAFANKYIIIINLILNIVILMLIFLEGCICILQAYVFTVLNAIYLKDAFELH